MFAKFPGFPDSRIRGFCSDFWNSLTYWWLTWPPYLNWLTWSEIDYFGCGICFLFLIKLILLHAGNVFYFGSHTQKQSITQREEERNNMGPYLIFRKNKRKMVDIFFLLFLLKVLHWAFVVFTLFLCHFQSIGSVGQINNGSFAFVHHLIIPSMLSREIHFGSAMRRRIGHHSAVTYRITNKKENVNVK